MERSIQTIKYLFPFMVLACCSKTTGTRSLTPPPNILFIMVDDLGYGDLGSYGQKSIHTPYLDKLAAEGMRFTQCYAGSPVCAPSRSVLLTGRHTGHTTVRGNTGKGGVVGLGGRSGRIPLLQNDTTIAEVLKTVGYKTGISGKWGLGEPGTSGQPNRQGFDEFFGFLNQRRAHSYYVPYLWHNQEQVILEKNQNGNKGTYVHDLFTDFALNFIRDNRDTSFFLYLPYTIPHAAYEVPELGIYADSIHWEETEQIAAAMITRMDRDIGRIMKLLMELNIDNNTILFFCSDNGAAERWDGRFNSSGILRGRKRDLYEGGLRTPMIVRYPGKIPPSSSSDLPWHFMDVLPTLASIAGATSPKNIDGRDISPVFWQDNENLALPETLFYWEFYERGFQQAVRWKNWKGVRLGMDRPWEIYDLESDPSEEYNVAETYPDIAIKIGQVADAAHQPSSFFVKRK